MIFFTEVGVVNKVGLATALQVIDLATRAMTSVSSESNCAIEAGWESFQVRLPC